MRDTRVKTARRCAGTRTESTVANGAGVMLRGEEAVAAGRALGTDALRMEPDDTAAEGRAAGGGGAPTPGEEGASMPPAVSPVGA